MTPEELRELGEKLYGSKWQTPLAREVYVTTRSVRYWLAGKHEIKPLIAEKIRGLAAEVERG